MDTSTLLTIFGFVEPKINTIAEKGTVGEYQITPLKEGFGTTVGNSLRRTLLSSLPGAAITELHLDGVSHEFSTLPGVREDILEITLNLKKIRLQLFEGDSAVLTLDAKGVKTVQAKDLKCPANVKIINPDEILLHLTEKKAKIHAECTVERGTKFLVRKSSEAKKKDITTVLVDSIFTPILNVEYHVSPTRVGKATNYDELRIKITTDGTIAPKQALLDSAKILTSYFRLIASEDKFDLPEIEKKPAMSEAKTAAIMLEDLNLSTRTKNSLKRNNITSIEQILGMREEQLLRLKNFGQKALIEIKEELASHGISLEKEPPISVKREDILVDPEELDII